MSCLPTGLYPGPEHIDEERAFERLLPSVTCTVVRGGWYEFPPGWRVTPRVPTYSIAFICVSGAAQVRIGEEAYALVPGTVILSPADVQQEVWNEAPEPVWMHTVAFSARLYGLLDLPALCGLPVEQQLDGSHFDEVVGIARLLVRELMERRPGYGLATNAACLRLVAVLWRSWVATDGEPSRVTGARVVDLARLEPVLHAIQSRYAETLTLEQMASLVHLHPAYFSTIFHRATGLPPSQYLARYRLRRAHDLLLSTDRSIREIAAATGFRDPFYLSRAFRRAAGVSPSEYRKARGGTELP
jgi:AraC-like DNA-binding protein/quercetin dioxygenase-like cupin family protein